MSLSKGEERLLLQMREESLLGARRLMATAERVRRKAKTELDSLLWPLVNVQLARIVVEGLPTKLEY